MQYLLTTINLSKNSDEVGLVVLKRMQLLQAHQLQSKLQAMVIYLLQMSIITVC